MSKLLTSCAAILLAESVEMCTFSDEVKLLNSALNNPFTNTKRVWFLVNSVNDYSEQNKSFDKCPEENNPKCSTTNVVLLLNVSLQS